MPPAVAHAPIVTRSFASARRRAISTACSGVEIEPSTRRTSNGPDERREVASANSTISKRSAISRRSILDVEDRQLAAVARGELDDADSRPAGGGGAAGGVVRAGGGGSGAGAHRDVHHRPSRRRSSPSSATLKTGPSLHTKPGPELAVAAQPDAALHVPLEGHPGVLVAGRRGRRGRRPSPPSSAPGRR